MKKKDRLIRQLMIRYINTTNKYIKELENQIDRLEELNDDLKKRNKKLLTFGLDLKKQNDFLMERENKLQNLEMQNLRCWSYIDKMEKQNKKKKTHEHGEWYDFVTKDGIGVRFGRKLDDRCTVIHKVHRFNK